MAHILVHHKVEDYKEWKGAYDKHSDFRGQNGSKGGKVFQNASNPNEVFVLLEWDNLENAQKFSQSTGLKEAMAEAGVVGMPNIYFVKETAASAK